MENSEKIKLAQNTALIAGIFCTAVALLLLLNFFQMAKSDPIESSALEALVQRLHDEPNNEELKVEIRNFDLLARKAYFNSRWQVKTGAYLLLFGAIVLALALRVYNNAKSKITEPDTEHDNEILGRLVAQKGIIIVGALVMVSALAASVATVNHLDYYDEAAMTAAADEEQTDQIEVIEVGKKTDGVAEAVPAEVPDENEQEISEGEEGKESDVAVEEGGAIKTETKAVMEGTTAGGFTLTDLQNNHNSFRGPLGQGIISHKNIPVNWDGSAGTNIIWKSSIPKHGFNSPVIWGDKLFVSGADEATREVYCFNRNDGKLLWTGIADNIKGSPATPPRVTEDTGLAAPTLATDGKRVYAIFANGDIISFDMEGNRMWARNLGVPDNHYGHSSSLIVWANKLFVQYDTNRGGKIMALNTTSGETTWETIRNAKISWASPILANVDGKYQLILTADPIVAGYDIETGEELWAVECMMGEVGPSVAFDEGIVFAANEYARLVAIDTKDGSIIWENDEYLPEASSPVAHNGMLIIATSYGVMACYDAKTGDLIWEHDVGTTLYSSPVVAEGKLYMMDNDGVMRVYEFSKEMKLLSENNLGEMAGSTPAFSDGRIYIRGDENLYCIGN